MWVQWYTLQGQNYSKSLVLGYGHAWLGLSGVRLQPLKNLKLHMGGMNLVIHAIVVLTIGLVTSRTVVVIPVVSCCHLLLIAK